MGGKKAAATDDGASAPQAKRGKRASSAVAGCACGSCGEKCLPDCSNWAEKELQVDARNNNVMVPIGPVCEGCAVFAALRYIDVAALCKAKQQADEKGKPSPYQKDLSEHKASIMHPHSPTPWGKCEVYEETIGGVYVEEAAAFENKDSFHQTYGVAMEDVKLAGLRRDFPGGKAESGLLRPCGASDATSSAGAPAPKVVRYLNTRIVMRQPLMKQHTFESQSQVTCDNELQRVHDMWGGAFASKYQPRNKGIKTYTDEQVKEAVEEFERKKESQKHQGTDAVLPVTAQLADLDADCHDDCDLGETQARIRSPDFWYSVCTVANAFARDPKLTRRMQWARNCVKRLLGAVATTLQAGRLETFLDKTDAAIALMDELAANPSGSESLWKAARALHGMKVECPDHVVAKLTRALACQNMLLVFAKAEEDGALLANVSDVVAVANPFRSMGDNVVGGEAHSDSLQEDADVQLVADSPGFDLLSPRVSHLRLGLNERVLECGKVVVNELIPMVAQRGGDALEIMLSLCTSLESTFEAALEDLDLVPEATHDLLDAICAVIGVVSCTPASHHFAALQTATTEFQDKMETIRANAMLALYHGDFYKRRAIHVFKHTPDMASAVETMDAAMKAMDRLSGFGPDGVEFTNTFTSSLVQLQRAQQVLTPGATKQWEIKLVHSLQRAWESIGTSKGVVLTKIEVENLARCAESAKDVWPSENVIDDIIIWCASTAQAVAATERDETVSASISVYFDPEFDVQKFVDALKAEKQKKCPKFADDSKVGALLKRGVAALHVLYQTGDVTQTLLGEAVVLAESVLHPSDLGQGWKAFASCLQLEADIALTFETMKESDLIDAQAADDPAAMIKRFLAQMVEYDRHSCSLPEELHSKKMSDAFGEYKRCTSEIKNARANDALENLTTAMADNKNRQHGGEDGQSWHSSLADTSTLTDCFDTCAESLFQQPDLYVQAERTQKAVQSYQDACHLVGLPTDADIIKDAGVMVSALGVTRTEALLLRLFNIDGLAQWGPEERDTKTRQIKRECQKFGKWQSVFKPIRDRAAEAMK
ncbi:unnamed protein product, partial [Prorocentrum cordatum]